jgi:hypothetical protein
MGERSINGGYMRFKFQVLDSAKFDKLPGKNMHENIGVAYPEKNEAYIRHSGDTMFDAFTIAHELEHLKGSDNGENYDSEFKCYYKKGDWWNPFGGNFGGDAVHPYLAPLGIAASALIPGLWPALGGMMGGLGTGFGSALSGMGMGGLTSILSPIGGAMSQMGAGLAGGAKGLQGMLGMGGGGGNVLGAQSGYAANAGRIGQGMGSGFGIGSGTASGSAGASAGGSVLGNLAGSLGKSAATNFGSNALMGMFQPKQNMNQMQNFSPRDTYQFNMPSMQGEQSNILRPGETGGSDFTGFERGTNPTSNQMRRLQRNTQMGFGNSPFMGRTQ